MNTFGSLSHSRWDCKYYVVFVPKCRRKSLYGKIREYLKQVLHELARQRGCQIVEGYMAVDHVHMCVSIPPKYSVSEVVGYMKGKSAIAVARQFSGRMKNFNGECFWARGYAVSTVGFELDKIRDYIRHQERLDGYELSGSADRVRFVDHQEFGKLTNVKKAQAVEKPAGQWNTYEIIADGDVVI